MIQGRLVKVIEPETIAVEANSGGYLVISIDLSQLNESSGTAGTESYTFTNNQLKCEVVQNLTQDNLNDGGLIYTFNLGQITSGISQVTFTPNALAYGANITNWNDITAQGEYFVDVSKNPQNAPYPATAYTVRVSKPNNNLENIIQESFPNDTTQPPYYRTRDNGRNWTDWRGYI